MNDFEQYFYNKSERLIHKWGHYFHFYDKYFSRYRDKNIKVLEIGVQNGGSLQMWQNYFGKGTHVIGMDIDANCKKFDSDEIKIFIGDQNNLNDLENLINLYKNFDIIIDDGSHMNHHQINTFKYLFPYLNEGGTYLVEDIHTSYWNGFGGGLKKESTFIEFTKSLIDHVNGYVIQPDPIISFYTNNISDIHIVSCMVFFEKNKLKYTPYDIGYLNGNKMIDGAVMKRKEIL